MRLWFKYLLWNCCEMLLYFFFKLIFVTELFYISMLNSFPSIISLFSISGHVAFPEMAFNLTNTTGCVPSISGKKMWWQTVYIDTNKWRKRPSSALKCIQLKEGAILCMFESTSTEALPSYVFSSALPVERITVLLQKSAFA